MSVYSVNLMYVLSSMTWLMIGNKVDFNTRDDSERGDDDEEEEQRKRDHRFYIRLRMLLLYFFVPVLMLVSVCGKLKFSQGWCLTSKIFLDISNLVVFLIFFYSLASILLQRLKDEKTPLKVNQIIFR